MRQRNPVCILFSINMNLLCFFYFSFLGMQAVVVGLSYGYIMRNKLIDLNNFCREMN